MTAPFEQALKELLDILYEVEETEEWDAADPATARAVELARSPADLWRIVDLEPAAEAIYGDGEYPTWFLRSIFDKASGWDGAERAATIALASRLTARDPGRIALVDDDAAGVRNELAAVYSEHIDVFREGVTASDAALQTASLHALALCPNHEEADLQRVSALIDDTTPDAPLATAAICLARMGKGDVFEALLTNASSLVRICAASARAIVTGTVDGDTAPILAHAIDDPVALPPSWGWVTYGRAETSAGLARRILSWCDVPAPLRHMVIAALATLADRHRRDRVLDRTLFRIAFGAIDAQPKLGYAREDLDTAQTAALAALGVGEDSGTTYMEPLGLWLRADVEPFLAGRGGMWRPLAIEIDGVARSWHLPRIWREHVWGALRVDDAVSTVVDGLQPDELLEALSRADATILLAKSPGKQFKEQKERHITLLTRVVEQAAQRHDLVPIVMRLIDGDPKSMKTAHGLALLYSYARRGEQLPANLDGAIGRVLAFILNNPRIADLLASFGERGVAIVAAAKAYRES